MIKCIHPLMKGREHGLIKQKLQREMKNRGLEWLMLCRGDNVFYATGFKSSFAYQYGANVGDTLALVPAEGDITLIVNNLETDNAQSMTVETEVVDYPSLAFIDDGSSFARADKQAFVTPYAAFDKALTIMQPARMTGLLGTEIPFIGSTAWAYLTDKVPSALLVDATPVVMGARRIKTPWEADLLRQAVQLTEKVWQRIAQYVRPGLNAYEINRMFKLFTAEADAYCAISEDPFLPAVGPFIGLGTMPRDYVLRDGDIIKFDAGFRYCGYTSDIARTLAVGQPSAVAEELYRILYEANRLGAAMLKPGVAFAEVYRAVRAQVEQSALIPAYPRGNVGHSIGVSTQIVEAPIFSKTSTDILEPGMVITLETPWSGTDGAPLCAGYNIEDCYLITEQGAEQWTTAPSTLIW